MASEINVLVGGEAGQGIQTIGFILAKIFARAGANVFADQDYESRVRGGHNFYRVRASADKVNAIREEVNILVAIDQNTINLHRKELIKGGVIIFDSDKNKVENSDTINLGLPMEKIAEEKVGDKVMANSVAIGAAIAAAGYEFPTVEKVLREQFIRLGTVVADNNVKIAEIGFRLALEQHKPIMQPVRSSNTSQKMMLLNGNEAIALGAMAAGCKFMAAYPMTPVSSIMEYISEKGRKFNIVMIQPEDEIAAINMAIGAGYAGVRAMTATAGDGFALMTEGLGLAGITETPVVIILGQRVAPAVGMPTRTEQGDLNFAVYGGAGEFPRAVFAPCTIEGAFSDTITAFNVAEKYQLPVIVITDHHLASSYQTVPKFDLREVKIDRGALISEEAAGQLSNYKRHLYTESGISPRLIPGRGKQLVVTDADEHDESGHMIEDADTRTMMMQKRLKKLENLAHEMPLPQLITKPKANITLVGWGGTFGAITEAAEILNAENIAANVLQITGIYPFPKDLVSSALAKTKTNIIIENNATGQMARIIEAETGIKVTGKVLKFDGRPFSPSQIAAAVKKEAA